MSLAPSDYLFVARSLRPVGGEEALAARCLQCLLQRGKVTVIAFDEPDLEGLDRMAGTNLSSASFDVLPTGSPMLAMMGRLGFPVRLLSFRLFMRRVRSHRKAGQPCLLIGSDLDLGDSFGVWQYVADLPRFYQRRLRRENLSGAQSGIWRALVLLNLRVKLDVGLDTLLTTMARNERHDGAVQTHDILLRRSPRCRLVLDQAHPRKFVRSPSGTSRGCRFWGFSTQPPGFQKTTAPLSCKAEVPGASVFQDSSPPSE